MGFMEIMMISDMIDQISDCAALNREERISFRKAVQSNPQLLEKSYAAIQLSKDEANELLKSMICKKRACTTLFYIFTVSMLLSIGTVLFHGV